jgi:hypothetical protein
LSVRVVVADVEPEVPLMVRVYVPARARLFAVIFNVEVVVPLMEVGLKLAVTREGWPDTDNAMVGEPEVTFAETVEVTADPPGTAVRDVGFALIVKAGAGAVMVSETVVVSVAPPPVGVPVMVMA